MAKKEKRLKNLDEGHPFYSDAADRARKKLLIQLEKEEREMILHNRRRYRAYSKGEQTSESDSE